MLETAIVAARDRARLVEIASILIRFGVDGLVGQLGLRKLLPRSEKQQIADDLSLPERLRQAIEALGPTYVKLGQILATRHDLLEPEWTSELEKLHSHVTAVPWDQMASQLSADLGADPTELFLDFNPEPLAAASMAQIYQARLHDGTEIILKARRPDLRATIEADLRLLSHAAQLLAQSSPEWERIKPEGIVSYLASALRDELDFAREGHNCEQVAASFVDQPEIVFPKIYWQWTSERLLVQQFLRGMNPTHATSLVDQGLDPALLAKRGALAILQMILQDGLFHADPHPGNLLAMSDNRVGFIDFGMVGHLSDRRKAQVLILFKALVEGRGDGVASMLLSWSDYYDADPVQLDMAVERFLAQHSTGTLQIGRALSDFMSLARQQRITLPADLSLLFKTFITADGVLRRVDPNLDIVRLAEPMVKAEIKAHYDLPALKKRATYLAAEFYDLAAETPSAVRLLLHRLRHGRIGVDMELRHLDKVAQSLEKSAIRLCVALVTAAFALGLAPRLFDLGPMILGMPLFAWLGLGATLIGCFLLFYWLFKPK
ncbi:MAG TPA: phosphotransferase [Alcaligenaceae bacterium]|nr:phosphotransferase [Alcaligenaceae bacterium]